MEKLNFVIYLIIVVTTFGACRGGMYIDDFINVQWICNDINIQFKYTGEDCEKGRQSLVKDDKQ